MVEDGQLLWEPDQARRDASHVQHFIDWLRERGTVDCAGYHELWAWSVSDLDAFWSAVWEFCGVRAASQPTTVLADRSMPGAEWFPGVTLNYAENALWRDDDTPALVFAAENGRRTTISRAELRRQVGAVAAGLRRLGVEPGDRVVGVLPNIPEAVVAFLATASIGGVWSSCPPEFGTRSIIDRLSQIGPKVLLAVDGYTYGGKPFDILGTLDELRSGLSSVRTTVLVPYLSLTAALPGTVDWSSLMADPAEPEFLPVPFDHPLWILYSSGTTGLPKPIIQGHGGIVLEHLKSLQLHCDLGPGDRFFWYTTTGWMMWNFLVSGLLVGATCVLYDGSAAYPDADAMWRLAAETGVTYFGTSAGFVHSCMKQGQQPGKAHDLSAVRTVGVTGSPLTAEGFAWLQTEVGPRTHIASTSGGTDICCALVNSSPLLPVHAGELQCPSLGVAVAAFDADGRSVVDQVGELVVTAPMPSMPLGFWGDDDGNRLRSSYYDMFPGVWRHGDWVRLTSRGTAVIYGRSDSTLNRGGVRMGTSDFYRIVEEIDGVEDSLVVDTSGLLGQGELLLFVVAAPGHELDEAFRQRISAALRRDLSPRHVPDRILRVKQVPRTLNGKKCEVPVRRILLGAPVDEAVSLGSLRDASALEDYVALVPTVQR